MLSSSLYLQVLKMLPYPKYNPPLPPEQPVRRLLYNLAKPDKKYGKFFEARTRARTHTPAHTRK